MPSNATRCAGARAGPIPFFSFCDTSDAARATGQRNCNFAFWFEFCARRVLRFPFGEARCYRGCGRGAARRGFS
eukprot:1198334-Pyramimonas_sp.AAC.1